MTTYYVRKSGSDANDGLSPSTAWLTLGKAAGMVAAGDTVYVGAGVYREQVTMTASGSSGSPIRWIADVTGEYTGDAGLVVISARDSDGAAPVRASCLDPGQQNFVEWHGFVFDGGTSAAVYNVSAGNTVYEGCIFEGCVFLASSQGTGKAFFVDLNEGVTPPGDGLIVRGCTFFGGMNIDYSENATASVDSKIAITDCLFLGPGGGDTCLRFNRAVDSTYAVGGFKVRHCTFVGANYGIRFEYPDDATYPSTVYNCLFAHLYQGIRQQFGAAGAVVEDYNRFIAVSSNTYGTTGGANDASGIAVPLAGIADFPLYRYLGWSPFSPWEPIRFLDGSYEAGVVDAASASYATTEDVYGNSRPGWRGYDIGAVEARARAEQEGTTVHGGNYAVKLAGAGYHEVILPVTAGQHTISVYARRDANYSGSPPKLQVLNIPGQADQETAMTAGANTWEQLSVVINPTMDGFVRVRLVSQDASANGECYFDDLAVT
ncbi:MAG TPA: hypothetical protein G4O02_13385 [Caldilineae bacterium]|nr:hypothetical protein [Caldilineae bacterium]